MGKSDRRSSRNATKSSAKSKESSRDSLAHILAHVGHFLSDQGPIGVFVHHNTLHAYGELGFHKAIGKATDDWGAEGYMTEAAFHECLANGRIRSKDLDAVLESEGISAKKTIVGRLVSERKLYRIALTHPIHAETAAGLRYLVEEHF